MAERPADPHSRRTPEPAGEPHPAPQGGFAEANGWDREYEVYSDFDLPVYVGPSTFAKLPWVTDPAELRARGVDVAIVGAPFDDAVSNRPGARFAPRAIREANYATGSLHTLQHPGGLQPLEILTVVDAGDANVTPAWIERGHALIYRKVLEVAETGAIPMVMGGDHSITWPSATAIAEVRRPGSIGVVHFDAHADTANEDWGVLSGHGTPMRRLIESGAVKGRNFIQVGLRGYWPPVETFEWMRTQGMRWHYMREIEERGSEAVVADAITEALDGPDYVYISVDIDVIDPGLAPGTGTPEPGGMLTREVLRAIRHIVGAVELAGLDVVEVSPPYDHAETTAMAANRVILEAIGSLAAKKGRGPDRPLERQRVIPGLMGDATETSAQALARLYDIDLVDDPGDLDLYVALARRTGGPILELGVGTGRLAVPLAAEGYDVTGIDIDPAVLARARLHAAGRGPEASSRLELVEADLLGLRPGGEPHFRLAFIALNSLMLLGSWRDQRAAVRVLAEQLAPGGVAAADVWLPDADDLARFDGRLILEYPRTDPETGRVVTKIAAASHDAATQAVRLTTIYEEGRPGEPALRWLREDRLRLVSADELRHFAEDAGLVVETVAGSYDLEPLEAGSQRAILIAAKPDPLSLV